MRRSRPARVLVVAALLLGVLAACADDDSGRRFANEPPPTLETVAEASPTRMPRPTSTPATPLASPIPVEELLTNRGGSQPIALAVDQSVYLFASNQSQPERIWQGDGELLDIALAPDGERVAILVQEESGLSLLVLATGGEELARFDGLDRLASSSGSPVPSAAGAGGIAWSPASDAVMVALPTGGVALVSLGEAEPQLVIGPNRAPAPSEIVWSPDGRSIAYLDSDGSGSAAGIVVASVGAAPFDPVQILPADPSGRQTVRDLAWLPDNKTLLYSTGSTRGDLSAGGDLFAISTHGGSPRLVAASARVAPVSAIGHFAPSPDGQVVAYTVVAPSDDGQPTTTFWVQQIDGEAMLNIPVPAAADISGLWWTPAGLVIRADPRQSLSEDQEPGGFALLLAEPGGNVITLYDSAAPAGTPVASPAASPVASPSASPAAASPAAEEAE